VWLWARKHGCPEASDELEDDMEDILDDDGWYGIGSQYGRDRCLGG
jgi:hypothetical protein